MTDARAANYNLTTVVASANLRDDILGVTGEYEDLEYANPTRIFRKLSGFPIMGRLVKSSEADALLPCQVLMWDPAYVGKRVKRCTASGTPCGVVPVGLPAAGVSPGDGFMMINHGPVTLISDGSTSISAGDEVISIVDGEAKKRASSWADAAAVIADQRSLLATAIDAATNVDQTKFRALLNFNRNCGA